jgi:tripartite-type tricarboxylate transporter receptor subunit TctC
MNFDTTRMGIGMIGRRNFLRGAATSLVAGAVPVVASAQPWPSRPVRIVAPSAPGGSLDILARLFARGLSDQLGQSFVVENRGGGGGNIGFDAVSKSPPDGHTLMIASDPLVVNPLIYSNLTYDSARDFAPIITIATLSQVLAVNPKLAAPSFAEFVALARSRPNTINVGTSGVGSPGHLAIALLVQAGVPVVHVPYRGAGPAVIDAVGGQIDATIVTLPASIAMIRQSQLRALAVTSSRRSRFAPEVASMSELLPSVVVDSWQAFFAPAGTPPEIVSRLNATFATLLQSREVMDAFETQAFEAGGGSPEELGTFMRAETVKWSPIIKAAGIRAE